MPQLIKEIVEVGCAFCHRLVPISGLAKQVNRRKQTVGSVKCPHCDSRFEIDLSTRRVSKGKRFKEAEAVARAEHDKRVAAVKAENELIAARMLAEPGCICKQHAPNAATLAHYGDSIRADGLNAGGTGANGLPLPPRHRGNCPRRDPIPEVKS